MRRKGYSIREHKKKGGSLGQSGEILFVVLKCTCETSAAWIENSDGLFLYGSDWFYPVMVEL